MPIVLRGAGIRRELMPLICDAGRLPEAAVGRPPKRAHEIVQFLK